MPIYAYRCASCGHAQDVLQRLSDPLLNVCPACGEATYRKQLTAAGFQLKGSGWYATDFRNGGGAKAEADVKTESGEPAKEGGDASAADKPAADKKPADAAKAAPASAVPVTPKGGAAPLAGAATAAPAAGAGRISGGSAPAV